MAIATDSYDSIIKLAAAAPGAHDPNLPFIVPAPAFVPSTAPNQSTYITDTLGVVDLALGKVAEDTFTILGAEMAPLLHVGGILGLILIAVNGVFQWVPVPPSEYIRWVARYVVTWIGWRVEIEI